MTNILYDNNEILQNTPIDNLIVVLSGEEIKREKAITYLETNQVTVKTIKHNQNVISFNQEKIV